MSSPTSHGLQLSSPTVTFFPGGIQRAEINFDVLLHIQSLSSSRTSIFRLMKTCRTLYVRGIPKLLALDRPVFSVSELKSFVAFMRSSTYRQVRFQHLRSLCLSLVEFSHTIEQDKELSEMLANVFELANELRMLSVFPARYLIPCRHPILSAIRVLPNLGSLTLDDADQESLDLLSSSQSPIRELTVAFEDLGTIEYDPIPALGRLSSTLTSLCVKTAYMDDTSTGVRCPQVRELTLGNCDLALAPIVETFPNLSTLTFVINPLGSDPWDNDFELEDFRSLNMSSNTWAQLDLLSGGPYRLYSLGVHCRSTQLDVKMVTEDCIHWACPAIHDTLPMVLRLSLFAKGFTISAFGESLSQLLRASPSLSTLMLCIELNGSSLDMGYFTPTLLSAFRGLLTDKLQLDLKHTPCGIDPYVDLVCKERQGDDECPTIGGNQIPERNPTTGPISDYFQQTSMESLASDIAQVVPALRYVSLSFKETSGTTFYWSVSRDVIGVVTLIQLDPTAEEIMEERVPL